MREIDRIARLFKQTFEGSPYYGPSVLGALESVPASVAARRPRWSAHCIWELVTHLTAELTYALDVLGGYPEPWVEGETTWPTITDTSEEACERAIKDLKKANRALVRAIKKLDESILDKKPPRVRGPYHLMLHGTMQHNIYHAGQISLLTGQIPLAETDEPE